MRGEEVLCLGLLQLGRLKPPGVVLNLGSHWKAVRLNREGQIESSITSLSGELIHAAQTQTILASSLTADRPARLARQWIEAGMKEQRRSGLSRALFSVRLLELADQGTPSERFSFLVGAFISSDLGPLFAKGMLSNAEPVVITGSPAIAESWREVLAHRSVRSVVVTADETEQAFLAGLKSILVESLERAN
jgi:2-keto-3-deoxy-galactonokinase